MEMIFEISDLSFWYPNSEKKVLNRVSLTLRPGQILSVLGPNGAGKSTLLNCMAGLFTPREGEILLGGKPLAQQTREGIARMIGYVQQTHVPAFAYSVFQFVMMGRAPHVRMFGRPKQADEDAVWDALERLGVAHLADKPYTEISGGERQQCVIARAVAQQPRAILFDEPTAHLDFGNQARILRLIRRMSEDGYAVVMTTHNPDHVLMLGGSVAILDRKGALCEGETGRIMTEQLLQEVYGTDIRLLYIDELARSVCLHAGLNEGGRSE